MGHIDSLTVLSTDGASDVVKNVTRTVTEASTTVKGLTGIDIPALLSQALGSTGGASTSGEEPDGQPPGGARPAPRPPSGGGTPGGGAGGRATPPTGTTSTTGGQTPAGSAPTDSGAPGARTSSPAVPPPRFEAAAAVDAAIGAADRTMRATSVAGANGAARTDTAAGPARPARPRTADIGRQTTLDDAARRLATDLRAVPGIQRFSDVRLAQLEGTGPRPLRTMWRVARDEVDTRLGEMTIGELLDRYPRSGPAS
jgi:hypothetical protein